MSLLSNDEIDASRKVLEQVPVKVTVGCLSMSEYFEVPGFPAIVYQMQDYSKGDFESSKQQARKEFPFLFRAFEQGQPSSRQQGNQQQGQRTQYFINEYLDWTVTAAAQGADGELDFKGFRLVAIYPRYVAQFPNPYDGHLPGSKPYKLMGGPMQPVPKLIADGKAIGVATIRTGHNHIELPFMVTADSKRGKGYGKALLESIEQIGRHLGLPYIVLCSTNDKDTLSFWKHVGFKATSPEECFRLNILDEQLMHMDQTLIMLKKIPTPNKFKSILLKHEEFVQRVYVPMPP